MGPLPSSDPRTAGPDRAPAPELYPAWCFYEGEVLAYRGSADTAISVNRALVNTPARQCRLWAWLGSVGVELPCSVLADGGKQMWEAIRCQA